MKKILFLFVIVPKLLNAQNDTVVVHHSFYTSKFSKSKHIPYLVEYTLRKSMLECNTHIKRSNKFTKDPEIPEITNLQKDYARSGYDRGHNMSAQDNECSDIGMQECFYFSNMFPQPHEINAGIWENLERHERELAKENDSVLVFICSIGKVKTIGRDKVVVPAYDCKVIYIYSTGKYEAYKIPNTTIPEGKNYSDYKIDIFKLVKESGIYFNFPSR